MCIRDSPHAGSSVRHLRSGAPSHLKSARQGDIVVVAMPTPPPVHVPDPEDLAGLLRAARDHLFVGMSNADQLEAEGGPAIPIASKGIRFRDLAGHGGDDLL